MADFEGKMNLDVKTSEIKIEGKFKLSEEELDTVAGGGTPGLNYPTVGLNDSCDDWRDGGKCIALQMGTEKPHTCRYCFNMWDWLNVHYCRK